MNFRSDFKTIQDKIQFFVQTNLWPLLRMDTKLNCPTSTLIFPLGLVAESNTCGYFWILFLHFYLDEYKFAF